MKSRDTGLFASVANLSWVADGIDESESDTALALIDLGLDNAESATRFIEAPWSADGINADEAWAFTSLAYLFNEAPGIAATTSTLSWLEDGIDEHESLAISFLPDLVDESRNFARKVISKSWFTDGISEDEALAIEALGFISHHTGSGSQFADMPFLNTVEPADSAALTSLAYLAIEDKHAFETIMSHQAVSDGITDDEAIYLTLATGVSTTNPELVDTLLNHSGVLTEMRENDLPVSGKLQFVIVRTRQGAAGKLELLEDAVRFMEDYMGEPFPFNVVLLLFADINDLSVGGYNFGASMFMDTEIDIDADESSDAERVLVHEVAHYYWRSSSHSWIDEGVAEILSFLYEDDPRALHGEELLSKVYMKSSFCRKFEDLQAVEKLTDTRAEGCEMAMGFLFFLDLYRALGPEDFQKGLRELYLLGEDAIGPEDSRARSIDQVKAAFSFSSKAKDEIIPKWYGAEK